MSEDYKMNDVQLQMLTCRKEKHNFVYYEKIEYMYIIHIFYFFISGYNNVQKQSEPWAQITHITDDNGFVIPCI